MEEIKLSKSHAALYETWMEQFREILASVTAVINELLNVRLAAMASEMGIDITNGEWRWDAQAKKFCKIAKPQDENPEEIKEAEIILEEEK